MKQHQIADLYSDYLLASFGATTATGLSQLLEGEVSHDQITRYLAGTKNPAIAATHEMVLRTNASCDV